jgi:hypothetical protein
VLSLWKLRIKRNYLCINEDFVYCRGYLGITLLLSGSGALPGRIEEESAKIFKKNLYICNNCRTSDVYIIGVSRVISRLVM